MLELECGVNVGVDACCHSLELVLGVELELYFEFMFEFMFEEWLFYFGTRIGSGV